MFQSELGAALSCLAEDSSVVEMTFRSWVPRRPDVVPRRRTWAVWVAAEMSKGQTMAVLVAEHGPSSSHCLQNGQSREVLEDGNLFAGERITKKFTWLIHAD